MKIGYYSESRADQAALAVFTEGILGEPPEPISGMDLEGRGVTGVLRALGGVFHDVYYKSDAEGLVIVVDCDNTDLHDPAHDAPGQAVDNCRYCELRRIINGARKKLKPIQGRPKLKVAIGLAVPTIEAWYLVGKNHEVGEAAWRVGLKANRLPFTGPQLKKLVYGSEHSSLEHMSACAEVEARRIIRDLGSIESAFPVGFGLMAQEIRSWVARSPGVADEP